MVTIPQVQLRRFDQANELIHVRVVRDLERVWRAVNTLPVPVMRDELVKAVPAIIDRYGSMSASVAAAWYEVLVQERAFVPNLFEQRAFEGSTRWALDPLFHPGDYSYSDPVEASFSHLEAAAARHVLGYGRKVISESVERTPGVFYARVPTSDEPCSWCIMLASRGPVYGSRRTAGTRESDGKKYHDKCSCRPVPMRGSWSGGIWSGDEVSGYDHQRLYDDLWKPHTVDEEGNKRDSRETLNAVRRSLYAHKN